jgi:iron complex outermembrane receptor protein
MNAKIYRLIAALFGILALGSAAAWAQPASALAASASGTATLTGNVSNVATGNLLEGARGGIKALGREALSDATGRYVLSSLPAGSHEVTVSYAGLDPVSVTVNVPSVGAVTRDFNLSTEIYKLDAFKVTGEREGFAAAITAERNADNVKNVVAMDQFGNLPNLNAGEVAMRLPGVVGNLDNAGNSFGFTIRGMPSGLNVVTMDGALLTSQGAAGRTSVINNITGTMFEQVEITKGHRPDQGADSLGGTINLKSRSPLSLAEKRRVTYSLTGRLAPSFTQQIPLRREHPFHQTVNLGWQEVFGVFGGERNLGVAVNLFESENALGWFQTTRDFENTTAQPAYLWDYREFDVYSHRRQNSINAKVDFRLSPRTKLTALVMAADHADMFRREYNTRFFTTQQIGTTGTAGILPGYTDRITRVRAAPGSTIDVTSRGPDNFVNRTRRVDLGAEHNFGPFDIDYNARRTQTHASSDNPTLLTRVTGVGWMLDRTQSDLYPKVTQTEGPDFTNPANFRPAANGLTRSDFPSKQTVDEFTANVRYKLPIQVPAFLKVGAFRRDQTYSEVALNRRWSYIGTSALPVDPSIVTWTSQRSGSRIPQWQTSMFMSGDRPNDLSLWREDVYFNEQNKFTGSRYVNEVVNAGYIMGQVRFGRTGILGGVRTEETTSNSWGWVRARALSNPAQVAADPIGSAQRDYAGNLRKLHRAYTKSFPSVHVTREFTDRLRGRLSWSTSFGRPALSHAYPNETPNEAQQTLTINNPGLLPQTASNWDATLDYYLKPVGTFSAGFFRKTISDYIVPGYVAGTVGTGSDNGYNGEYAGFTLLRSTNAGTAYVQGWEFSYLQQFTFLPSLLKGLSAAGNFTLIDTHGNFGGNTNLKSNQVAGFIPRSGNASISWQYRGFSVRLLGNHSGRYITSYSAASVGRNTYRFSRKVFNLGFAYQVRPSLTLTCDIDNLTNEEQALYRGIPDQTQSRNIPGTTITFGVSGRF